MSRLNNLYRKMIEFYRDDPARIQHFIKVHSFAKLIGEEEHLDEKLLYILEAAAYVHDIGIRPAEAKFGRCDGKLQEQESTGYPILLDTIIHTRILMEWIIRFLWRLIFW